MRKTTESIAVTPEVREELEKAKLIPREPLSDVIARLLKSNKIAGVKKK